MVAFVFLKYGLNVRLLVALLHLVGDQVDRCLQ